MGCKLGPRFEFEAAASRPAADSFCLTTHSSLIFIVFRTSARLCFHHSLYLRISAYAIDDMTQQHSLPGDPKPHTVIQEQNGKLTAHETALTPEEEEQPVWSVESGLQYYHPSSLSGHSKYACHVDVGASSFFPPGLFPSKLKML